MNTLSKMAASQIFKLVALVSNVRRQHPVILVIGQASPNMNFGPTHVYYVIKFKNRLGRFNSIGFVPPFYN